MHTHPVHDGPISGVGLSDTHTQTNTKIDIPHEYKMPMF